jgi:hypothetical protein
MFLGRLNDIAAAWKRLKTKMSMSMHVIAGRIQGSIVPMVPTPYSALTG